MSAFSTGGLSVYTHGSGQDKAGKAKAAYNDALMHPTLAPMQPPPVMGNPAFGPGRPTNQMFGLGPYNDLALRLSYGGQMPPQAALNQQAGPMGGMGGPMSGGPMPGFGGYGPPMMPGFGGYGPPMMHALGGAPQMLMPPGQGQMPPNPFLQGMSPQAMA